MKLHQKLPPAKRAIDFISRHDDEPLPVRVAALESLKKHIDSEIEEAGIRDALANEAKIANLK